MSGDLIVSLEEFADLVGVTGETMRTHLKAVEGQPDWLVERGDRGRAYKIEPRGGVAWWQARRDAEDAATEDRRQQLAQMRLDLVGPQVEGVDKLTLSGRQRRDEYEAAFKALEYRKRLGQLVERSEVDHVLTNAAVELRRRLMLVPGEFAIKAGLSAEVVKPLHDLQARAVNDFLKSIAQVGGGGDARAD
ncbi:MAG: hypothetical protein FJ335_13325 [Sphingomonadales bacterium]|nr:hypothetical protein [Sphingomonadales bacterium]